MMHDRRRAGGISSVLLARAILYKVCPSGGMGRIGSRLSSFRTDQRELAKIAGGQLCGDQTFPVNLAFLFPDRLLFILHNLQAMICASIQSMLLCKMLLTIYRKCAKIQTVREQHTPKQPEGPAEERSGGTVRSLARQDATGDGTLPIKQISPAGTGEAAHGSERKTGGNENG